MSRYRKQEKFFWIDPITRKKFQSGGILFYNDKGFWSILEEKKCKEYTDFGGKYNFEDGHIIRCIKRELEEESFGTIEIKTSELISIVQKINSGEIKNSFIIEFGTYYSLVLHTDLFPEIDFDNINFKKERDDTIDQNPFIDKIHYTSLDLVFINFDSLKISDDSVYYIEFEKEKISLSFRLNVIIKASGII